MCSHDTLKEKRAAKFKDWEESYYTVKSEITSLIDCFDSISKIDTPEFQDLTVKFYSIHLFNFYVFHVRQLFVNATQKHEIDELMLNGFDNDSWSPSKPVMKQLLSFLIKDNILLNEMIEYYSTLYDIRNKYSHGNSQGTNASITFEQFRNIFESICNIVWTD